MKSSDPGEFLADCTSNFAATGTQTVAVVLDESGVESKVGEKLVTGQGWRPRTPEREKGPPLP
ncbi:hypothetical protein [uncultured Roseibium sp.]|uniref:hypothetical protein n=1 Tax=uncultured Roseibium sp. TaxID=1936171 RepID=UPI0026084B61|nr:hypothetical protein [uncultured Roseibium sp.]